MLKIVEQTAEIEYPERDGKPMAETDTHRDLMADSLLSPLKQFYRPRPNVYVTGNINLYYQKGNPKAVVAQDVFVVFGIPKHRRRTYKLWEEGKAPDVVFEITSRKTRKEDLRDKRWLYEEIGVGEYFLFDPLREYLNPLLQGFRREESYFVPLKPEPLPGGEWQLESKLLGLILQTQGETLRLYDSQTKQFLLTHEEEAEARRAEAKARRPEAEARQAAEERAEAAEAEIARLRALLEKRE